MLEYKLYKLKDWTIYQICKLDLNSIKLIAAWKS